MKNFSLLLALLLSGSFSLVAQSIQPGPSGYDLVWSPDMLHRQREAVQVERAASCTQDTIQYGLAKATAVASLSINSATSADQLGQWYDATASNPVTIHGLSFTGWASAAVGANTLSIVCAVYNAGADSLPVAGPPLASATIQVDTNFFGGSLSALRKHATFATPVTVTGPYVVVVSNASASSLILVNNSWTAGNGRQEWLGMASIAGNWLHGYDLNIGGIPFDADALIEPHVTFDINTAFTSDQSCIVANNPVTFTNASDSFITSRFYNLYSFDAHFAFAPADSTYGWSYGDASPLDIAINGSHTYSGAQPSYDVTLFALILGYSRICVDSANLTVPVGAAAQSSFTFAVASAVTVDFTNAATGADSVAWDFGDGTTSTEQNPSHTYPGSGTYTVCQIAYGCAGNDTTCQEVSVINTALASGLAGSLAVFPNPTTGLLQVDLSLDQATEVQVSVLNLLGQEVRRMAAGTVQATRLALDLRGLEAGTYLVQVRAGDRQETRRISLQ